MAGAGEWLAHAASRWVARFRARHGLDVAPAKPAPAGTSQVLLHVGCGRATMESLPVPGFRESDWHEVRLDADPGVAPDILATMTDMSAVPDGFADAVYSSHSIEHLVWHDVPKALAEFRRVLKDDGFVAITCPDIQALASMIAEDRLFDTVFESDAGPITPFDVLYGYRPFLQKSHWMSHLSGFTLTTLNQVVRESGFRSTIGFRRIGGYDLWLLASKSPRSEPELQALARTYLHPQA